MYCSLLLLFLLLNFTLTSAKGGVGGVRISTGNGSGSSTPFGKNPGAIAGTVFGIVSFIAIVVTIYWWHRKMTKAFDQYANALHGEDTAPTAQRVAADNALSKDGEKPKKKWYRWW